MYNENETSKMENYLNNGFILVLQDLVAGVAAFYLSVAEKGFEGLINHKITDNEYSISLADIVRRRITGGCS